MDRHIHHIGRYHNLYGSGMVVGKQIYLFELRRNVLVKHMAQKKNNRLVKQAAVNKSTEMTQMSNPPLLKINFLLMAAAAVVIIVGFLLMLGPATTTEEFNPDIFSTRRIAVGPTIAFLGFIFMGIAIIYRPKKDKNEEVKNP